MTNEVEENEEIKPNPLGLSDIRFTKQPKGTPIMSAERRNPVESRSIMTDEDEEILSIIDAINALPAEMFGEEEEAVELDTTPWTISYCNEDDLPKIGKENVCYMNNPTDDKDSSNDTYKVWSEDGYIDASQSQILASMTGFSEELNDMLSDDKTEVVEDKPPTELKKIDKVDTMADLPKKGLSDTMYIVTDTEEVVQYNEEDDSWGEVPTPQVTDMMKQMLEEVQSGSTGGATLPSFSSNTRKPKFSAKKRNKSNKKAKKARRKNRK